MNQRILVVDDDKQIVRLVQSYLEQAGYAVLTAYDGATALRTIRTERPDLVVLDLMLPNQDGWSITRTVRADASQASLPIIMLTARVEDTDKIVGLEIGADDYIAKPFNPRELVARVRAVLRRAEGERDADTILRIGELQIDFQRRSVRVEGVPIDLTATEFELLSILAREPGRPFTRAQLLDMAYDVSYSGFDRTVDAHIKNLRRKIEPDPRNPRYVQTLYGVGYKFAEDVE